MSEKKELDITNYLYVSRATNSGHSPMPDVGYCRYSVFKDYWHSQCRNYPKINIHGKGFCKQHAKMIANNNNLDFVIFCKWS